jgi:hypothetical protein
VTRLEHLAAAEDMLDRALNTTCYQIDELSELKDRFETLLTAIQHLLNALKEGTQ